MEKNNKKGHETHTEYPQNQGEMRKIFRLEFFIC